MASAKLIQKIRIGLILAVMVGVLLVSLGRLRKGKAPEPFAGSKPGSQQSAVATPTPRIEVTLDRLGIAAAEQPESGRNPFSFRKVVLPPTRLPAPTPETRPNPPVSPMPVGPPSPLPIPLKLLGTLQRQDGTVVAILSDSLGPVFGSQGQVILGKCQLLKIGKESIEITYLDGKGSQLIRLTSQ